MKYLIKDKQKYTLKSLNLMVKANRNVKIILKSTIYVLSLSFKLFGLMHFE